VSGVGREFTCAHCGGTFVSEWSEEDAQAELARAFAPEERVDLVEICDACWRAFRWADPGFDARYQS
jgi:hypothetical protein